VTFLGWLRGDDLPRAYASADLFVFPSSTDTFGQVVIEAQASGLPIAAVAAGGPLMLIDDRVTGLLAAPSPAALSGAMLELSRSELLRTRLATAALAAARKRSWERALDRLAVAYRRTLSLAGTAAGTSDERQAGERLGAPTVGEGANAQPGRFLGSCISEPPVDGRRAA
jgi:glycosyltransferase involved in cell wall biosynthesis